MPLNSGGSDGKESAFNLGDPGWIPGLGRSPGEGYGNPLQYSCLENSGDREAWWAIVHGVAKSQTRLSTHSRRHSTAILLLASVSLEHEWSLYRCLLFITQVGSCFTKGEHHSSLLFIYLFALG